MIILCYCNSCCSCSVLMSPGHLPIIASLLAGQEMQRNILQGHSLCLSHTVCVCNIQSVSFTDSLCLSQTDYVCHSQFVSVADCLRLSQAVCVCHTQSVSDTDTLLDHSWPVFCLFIRDFHQDLSVRFEFVRRLKGSSIKKIIVFHLERLSIL